MDDMHFLVYSDPSSDIREPSVEGPMTLADARAKAEKLAITGAYVNVCEVVGQCGPRAAWQAPARTFNGDNVTALDRSKA
jgi:hypothetical protein